MKSASELGIAAEAFLALTLGEYLFDQWGGDWQRAVQEYSLTLDEPTTRQVVKELEELAIEPAAVQEQVLNEFSAIDLSVKGASYSDYLRHALLVLSDRLHHLQSSS